MRRHVTRRVRWISLGKAAKTCVLSMKKSNFPVDFEANIHKVYIEYYNYKICKAAERHHFFKWISKNNYRVGLSWIFYN